MEQIGSVGRCFVKCALIREHMQRGHPLEMTLGRVIKDYKKNEEMSSAIMFNFNVLHCSIICFETFALIYKIKNNASRFN